jgi:hypothetical protein
MKQLPERFSVYAKTRKEAEFVTTKQMDICGDKEEAIADRYYRFNRISLSDRVGLSWNTYLTVKDTDSLFYVEAEFTFDEFKAFFDILDIKSLGIDDGIHCETRYEYDEIRKLINAAGLSNTIGDAFNKYGDKAVVFPHKLTFSNISYTEGEKRNIYKSSRFIKTPVKETHMKETRIKRKDLRDLHNGFTCDTWKNRISKYLIDTFDKDDDFEVVITLEDLSYAQSNATQSQKHALKALGIAFEDYFLAKNLNTGEILEARDCANIKYVVRGYDGYILIYKDGITKGDKYGGDYSGKKLPSGTQITITAK